MLFLINNFAFRNREHVPDKIYKPLARRVARHSRERHFLVRHPLPCRGLASRRSGGFFAGQFLVGQPSSERGSQRFDEPIRVVAFALIISKRLFIEVAEQVKRLDTDIGAFDAALQERPEVLDPVLCEHCLRRSAPRD